jgi:hypothetical protein
MVDKFAAAEFCDKHPHQMLTRSRSNGEPRLSCCQCGRWAVANLDRFMRELRSHHRHRHLRDMPGFRMITFKWRGQLVQRRIPLRGY